MSRYKPPKQQSQENAFRHEYTRKLLMTSYRLLHPITVTHYFVDSYLLKMACNPFDDIFDQIFFALQNLKLQFAIFTFVNRVSEISRRIRIAKGSSG